MVMSMPTQSQSAKSEFEFLCCIVRPLPSLERARALLASGIDFDELTRLAAQHAVRPQLLEALAALGWEGVPPAPRRTLERFAQQHLVRTLAFTEELCRVAEVLQGAHVPFAAFKGVVLARTLYGDPAGREYNDIDIVVPAEHMEGAEDALAQLGYRGLQGDRAFRAAFLSYLRQFELMSRDDRFAVDLHWAFSGAYLPFPLAPDEIWSDLASLDLGGRRIPVLSCENLALLLAGHGTKEQWRLLEWIADFARLVARLDGIDWPAVHRRAEAHGCGGAVTLGAALVRDLLEMPLPASLDALVAADRRATRRAAALGGRLRFGLPEPEPLPNFSDLGLCDRTRDRIRAVLGLTFTPTAGDYTALKLPPSLWGLYRFTRPFRLAAKAVGIR